MNYGSFEGKPTVYTPGYAWSYIGGNWAPVNSSDVAMHGVVMSEDQFKKRFAHADLSSLPPMPNQGVSLPSSPQS
jgi:hypothetical protein